MRILIVYETRRGSTGKIASYMAQRLTELGHQVQTARASENPSPDGWDAVIAGSPAYYEKPLKPVVDWLRANREKLKDKPVCLFIVCMAQKFGHPFKSYVYRRYLGIMRKALGREPECQGDITGYILREPPTTWQEALNLATRFAEKLTT